MDEHDAGECDDPRHAKSEVILRRAFDRMLRWCYENQITMQFGSALGSNVNIVQTQTHPFHGFQNVHDKINVDELIGVIAHEAPIRIEPKQTVVQAMPLSKAPPHIQQAFEHAKQQQYMQQQAAMQAYVQQQSQQPKPAKPTNPDSDPDSEFKLPPDFPPFRPYGDHIN